MAKIALSQGFFKKKIILGLQNAQAQSNNCHSVKWCLSAVYTGDNTLNVVAVASDGDLKRWEDFY